MIVFVLYYAEIILQSSEFRIRDRHRQPTLVGGCFAVCVEVPTEYGYALEYSSASTGRAASANAQVDERTNLEQQHAQDSTHRDEDLTNDARRTT